MKNLLLLLLATFFLVSCEDIETNDLVLQANIDNTFYKSNAAKGQLNQNNFFVIEGFAQNEKLTLNFKYPGLINLELGGESSNNATFEDNLGNVYTTGPNATGEVIITGRTGLQSGRKLSGTFNFTAISSGMDTITVSNGIFFEIPTLEGSEDNGSGSIGTLSTSIDDSPLSPNAISAIDTGNSIVVLASNETSSVYIKVPIDVEEGFYDLPENGFSARYTLNAVEEIALAGNMVIISHDVNAKTLAGTFFFTTENHVVEQGQFNVSYQ